MKLLKALGPLIAGIALPFSSGFASKETIVADTPEGELRLSVNLSPSPVFPPSLERDGMTGGTVTVLTAVGQQGELIDWLVVKASHYLLARSVDNVIEEWNFDVPTLNGEPVPLVNRFDINFESRGSFIDATGVSSSINLMLGNRLSGFHEYGVASIKDLDGIPEPIYVQRPIFPQELLRGRSEMRAILDFYIDEEGDVHIPTVRAADDGVDDQLLIAAQNALWQWKFSPPTIKGKPVVAKAAQPFVFRALSVTSK